MFVDDSGEVGLDFAKGCIIRVLSLSIWESIPDGF